MTSSSMSIIILSYLFMELKQQLNEQGDKIYG
nr:MAG TPA: hypothetical protein [Caudoviricetes sp.]